MYNIITAEEMLDINNKIQAPKQQENLNKIYYGGGRECSNKQNNINLFYVFIIILLIVYLVYKFVNKKINIKFLDFTKNHDIIKLLFGLLILNNVRLLSTSLIDNLIFPLIEPIIPFLECNFIIKYYNNNIEIGKFLTDLLVFIINIFILYIIYIIIHNIAK